jgi:hypothetical protein
MAGPASPGTRSFFRGRGFKALVIVLAVVIILWVAVEIAAPRIADSIAANQIRKRYPQATEVSVSIRAFPALKLAFKKYDMLTVRASGVTLQGVLFDNIVLKSTLWPTGTFRATLGQGEIARFFSTRHSYISNLQLTLTPGGTTATGMVDLGTLSVAVSATGTLESVDGKSVFFRPQDVQVSGISMPEAGVASVRRVMEQQPVFSVREDLPYTITKILAEQGKLVILGNVNLEKALNIKL